MIIKKVVLIKEKHPALVLNQKLSILRQLNDEENIFLDYSSTAKGGIFSKKEFKFKIYYRYQSKDYLNITFTHPQMAIYRLGLHHFLIIQ